MTIGSARNWKQRAHDRLLWMEGVKVFNAEVTPSSPAELASKEEEGVKDKENEKLVNELGKEGGEVEREKDGETESIRRGTDGGTAREGEQTERGGGSVISAGSKTTAAHGGRGNLFANLGEEMTSVVRRFPRVNFEKVSYGVSGSERSNLT